jgi:hypothetical protein
MCVFVCWKLILNEREKIKQNSFQKKEGRDLENEKIMKRQKTNLTLNPT